MEQLNNWKKLMLLTAGIAMTFASGCTQEGFGGEASLSGVVMHHFTPIPATAVHIKFGAKELPGTAIADYDKSVVADQNGMYTFEGLEKGDYYLYAVGYDSAIYENVYGGAGIRISAGEANSLDLAVTE